MSDLELNQSHRLAAARLQSAKRRALKRGKRFDPKLATELEFHRSSISDDVQVSTEIPELTESYNFFLYYALKADEAGKDADSIRKHLLNAEKSRLRLKKFDVEHNKVRLGKEMWLRKKYDLPV